MPPISGRWVSAAVLASLVIAQVVGAPLKFTFGNTTASEGAIQVSTETRYTRERGYGFEPAGTPLVASDGACVTSDRPFYFTARVPREGNYRVTVTLGDDAAEATTTIKAELRRLMVADRIHTARGETKRVTFIVNTRTPEIAAADGIAAGKVRLKAPRETTDEAWAWDDAITLEFANTRPAVRAIEIEPAAMPTVFLLGDSTVCDQAKEPYNSWGQMLPRFFKPGIAVANHGESGETYRDSLARRRLDKILSVMRPGDWLLLQFGHNDQKQIAAGTGGPFTTYQDEMRKHVEAFRARGGTPVIVSPMERRGFDEHGDIKPSLIDYANAARDTARELGVAFIELNALSKQLYRALGSEKSARAFATAADGRVDNTHHNNYGSYQLAKCIVQALRDQQLPLARHVVEDVARYDPAQPDDPDAFAVPASGIFTNQRPLGDEPR